MRIELFHASKYGNGKKVAEEFREMMGAKGHQVGVHHINEVKPKEMAQGDLYVFISPTRIGKPIGGMRRFLKKLDLFSGTKYALIATHGAPQPNKKTGKMPTAEEIEKFQRTIPMMDEILKPKGMVKVADVMIYVTGLKGPLEEGWKEDLESFVDRIIDDSEHG
jgi:flavodoxin